MCWCDAPRGALWCAGVTPRGALWCAGVTHRVGLYDVFPPNWVIKSSRMRCVECVARETHTEFWWGDLREQDLRERDH